MLDGEWKQHNVWHYSLLEGCNLLLLLTKAFLKWLLTNSFNQHIIENWVNMIYDSVICKTEFSINIHVTALFNTMSVFLFIICLFP